MWKKATGTVTQLNRFQKLMLSEEKERKKLLKKKKLELEKKKVERKKVRELQGLKEDLDESDQDNGVSAGDSCSDDKGKDPDEDGSKSPSKTNDTKLAGVSTNNPDILSVESPNANKEDSKKLSSNLNNSGLGNVQQSMNQ